MEKWKLIRVDISHIDIIYRWANEPETRKYAFNTEPISYETHLKWMREKLLDDNCLFYILQEGEENIGQVRLDSVEKTGIISYSIDKYFRGKGHGLRILLMLEKEIEVSNLFIDRLNLLIGRVKYENIPSQRCFEKLGYIKKEYEQYIEYQKNIM